LSRKPTDDFLGVLEQGVRDVLKDEKAKVADKLKALDAGAKLLMVRHKIEGGSADGSFFSGN
jgi:hypothetical protein